MKRIRWKLQKSFKMSTIISYSRKFEREEKNFDNTKKKKKKKKKEVWWKERRGRKRKQKTMETIKRTDQTIKNETKKASAQLWRCKFLVNINSV